MGTCGTGLTDCHAVPVCLVPVFKTYPPFFLGSEMMLLTTWASQWFRKGRLEDD